MGVCLKEMSGSALFSRAVASQVSSAHASLTSVFGMGTGVSSPPKPPDMLSKPHNGKPTRLTFRYNNQCSASPARNFRFFRSSPRPISTGPLSASPRLHSRPINHVVYMGPYSINWMGYLILRMASRLDAFSAYPEGSWLPSYATGVTTGAPLEPPSRSSRTRDRPSQISCAHDR